MPHIHSLYNYEENSIFPKNIILIYNDYKKKKNDEKKTKKK